MFFGHLQHQNLCCTIAFSYFVKCEADTAAESTLPRDRRQVARGNDLCRTEPVPGVTERIAKTGVPDRRNYNPNALANGLS